MIIFRELGLRRGAKLLLQNTSVTIQPGQRLALIGANGSGKSSLFALLLGELQADTGHIEGIKGMRLSCMAQEVEASDMPALEYVIAGDSEVFAVRQQLADAESREDYERASVLYGELDELNGYDIAHRAEVLLLGLGFEQGDQHRKVSDFSGGWRIRLNLAKALMTPSDLLLLDEPTNHLDLDASFWLQQWLQSYQGTMLLISHDREFIDACCQQVLHLEHKSITQYRGNYSSFELQRAERLAQQQAAFEKQQRRIGEIDEFVRRFRYKATKAKQAQSRLKELERMQSIAPAHIDSPFRFRFPEPKRASDPILSLSLANLGYGDVTVLKTVNLQVHAGARIGLLGKNGAGKSTLLKSLTGLQDLLSGDRVEGAHCQIGYFDQHQLEALDLEASPALHLQRISPDAREQEIYDFLGGFNFHGSVASSEIRDFSGGEKARLALAITVWQRPNLLIMDEPTNHLDLEMRHALTVALQAFTGAVVLVTHDRHLLGNTVDELLLVHDGVVDEYKDDLAAYQKWVLNRESVVAEVEEVLAVVETKAVSDVDAESKDANRKEQRKASAANRAKLQPLKKSITRVERKMAECQKRLDALEQKLANTAIYEAENKTELDDVLFEQAKESQQHGELEEQWLELQQELEDLLGE
ncbi:MAG: ATP-binding cassette domain-containing protein [Pseudomonadales bacterium]